MYKYAVEELGVKNITLVGPSSSDLTNTLLWGDSGLMNAYPDDHPNKPEFSPHYGIVKHKVTGTITRLISSESPQRARGTNSELILADECSSYVGDAQEFFHSLMYGLRLGISQAILVTTPKANPLMIELLERAKDPNDAVELITGSTFENEANLSKEMIANAKRTMNTKFGAQEIFGELILKNDAAAFSPELLEKCQATISGEFHPRNWKTVCIGVDPAGESTSKSSDKTGIIVGALTNDNKVIIIDDKTDRMTGETAVRTISDLYDKYSQFCPVKIRVESNGVGQMFKAMIKATHWHLPIESFATVNKKMARAIACAFYYECGDVFHDKNAGLKKLEDEAISFDGKGKSPDHLDALGFVVEGLLGKSNFVARKKFIL